MTEEADSESQGEVVFLQESAFPTNLSVLDLVTLFWSELKKILPAEELHVIDPYALDAGGAEPQVYAGNVASLLKPALDSIDRVIFVHGKPREGIETLISADIALIRPAVAVRYQRGSGMHARYLIADRARVLRMEFSLNRIGKSFGTVSLVEDEADHDAILGELERLDPENA